MIDGFAFLQRFYSVYDTTNSRVYDTTNSRVYDTTNSRVYDTTNSRVGLAKTPFTTVMSN